MGPRRNMNGAGAGGRIVAKRDRITGRIVDGRTQFGNREKRRYEIRKAMASMPGATKIKF